MTKRLAKRRFAGMSSGGSVATTVKIEEMESGVIVAIICEGRSLSSDLFD
jgi:cysteine synthase